MVPVTAVPVVVSARPFRLMVGQPTGYAGLVGSCEGVEGWWVCCLRCTVAVGGRSDWGNRLSLVVRFLYPPFVIRGCLVWYGVALHRVEQYVFGRSWWLVYGGELCWQ